MKKTNLIPLMLVFYEIATYLSNDMYLPALPQMMQDLNLTLSQAQLTLTFWFLGSASTPLVMGIISDRYGRRPVLLWGGVIYIIATLVCALTHNVYLFLGARVIEGGMIASALVAGYACVHELYEQKEAIRVLAFMGSVVIIAPALGPLFGSMVLYFVSWRGIFWLIALWTFVALLFLYKWMPETLPIEKRHPINVPQILGQYKRVLTNKKFMFYMCVLGFNFCGFIAWITAGPLLVIINFQYSALIFGLIQAGVFAGFILGNRMVKYLIEMISIVMLIQLGVWITLCGGLSQFFFAYLFPEYLSLFIISMTLYSFGSALCFASLNRTIIEASDEPMGIRVALFSVFLTSFAVLGSAIASFFFVGSIISLASIITLSSMLSCAILYFIA